MHFRLEEMGKEYEVADANSVDKSSKWMDFVNGAIHENFLASFLDITPSNCRIFLVYVQFYKMNDDSNESLSRYLWTNTCEKNDG